MTYKIIIASTNNGKIQEITKIINSFKHSFEEYAINLELGSLKETQYDIVEPDEPHDNFLTNAIHKAKYYANHTQKATLSEDSGLLIEALNNFPGVRTKEFTIECGGMANTFIKLEQMLKETHNFAAYFHSAAAFYDPKNDLLISQEANDYGHITFPPRGNDGFAFDPIFIPEGFDQTFAELGPNLKNKISHRAKAITGIMKQLINAYASGRM